MTKTRQMVVAGMSGVMGTAADVVVLMLLVQLAVAIPVAAFLGSAAGAFVCFGMNKYVAFRDRSPITFEQVGRFAFVALTTAIAMAVMMKLVAVELGVPVFPAKLLCAAIVFFAWTYPAQRRLVFTRRSRPLHAEPSAAQSLA
ncbi:MAG: GtrA family protein [Deltaproteobacteria bacterium]|nr:GtrA family protein [Deltaproteobacteria bacterium]